MLRGASLQESDVRLNSLCSCDLFGVRFGLVGVFVVFLEEEVVVGEAGEVDFFCALVEHLFEFVDVGAGAGGDENAVVGQT